MVLAWTRHRGAITLEVCSKPLENILVEDVDAKEDFVVEPQVGAEPG